MLHSNECIKLGSADGELIGVTLGVDGRYTVGFDEGTDMGYNNGSYYGYNED